MKNDETSPSWNGPMLSSWKGRDLENNSLSAFLNSDKRTRPHARGNASSTDRVAGDHAAWLTIPRFTDGAQQFGGDAA